MPASEGVARFLVHDLEKRGGIALQGEGQGELERLFFIFLAQIPEHGFIAAVFPADGHRMLIAQDAITLQVCKEGEGPKRRFWDETVGHHAEASVEGAVRDALLLEDIAESPVAVAVRHIAETGEQGRADGRVFIGVVNGAEGIVTGVELGDIHGEALELREGIDDIP